MTPRPCTCVQGSPKSTSQLWQSPVPWPTARTSWSRIRPAHACERTRKCAVTNGNPAHRLLPHIEHLPAVRTSFHYRSPETAKQAPSRSLYHSRCRTVRNDLKIRGPRSRRKCVKYPKSHRRLTHALFEPRIAKTSNKRLPETRGSRNTGRSEECCGFFSSQ